MILIYARNQTRLNDKNLQNRLNHAEASSRDQIVLLADVKGQMDDVSKHTEANSLAVTKLTEALRLDWIRQLGRELKSFMRKIVVTNLAIYKAVSEIRGCLPSQLERSLYQEPFILEDGIGRVAPVHMQFISSWEAFDSVLELRFRGVQGYEMVRDRRYVIQENATKREIDRSRTWEAAFLPGQKVVMSMIFDAAASSTASCPRCQYPSQEEQSSEIHWYAALPANGFRANLMCSAGCGMFYRRIIEYNEVDPFKGSSRSQNQKSREAAVTFGQSPFKCVVFGPEEPDASKQNTASRKRKHGDSHDSDIVLFKRVRILSRKTRIRQVKPGSTPYSRFAKSTTAFPPVLLNSDRNQDVPENIEFGKPKGTAPEHTSFDNDTDLLSHHVGDLVQTMNVMEDPSHTTINERNAKSQACLPVSDFLPKKNNAQGPSETLPDPLDASKVFEQPDCQGRDFSDGLHSQDEISGTLVAAQIFANSLKQYKESLEKERQLQLANNESAVAAAVEVFFDDLAHNRFQPSNDASKDLWLDDLSRDDNRAGEELNSPRPFDISGEKSHTGLQKAEKITGGDHRTLIK